MKHIATILSLAILFCFVQDGKAGSSTPAEYIDFNNFLLVLLRGVNYKIECSTDLWQKSLDFIENLHPKAAECPKTADQTVAHNCLVALAATIKEHFSQLYDELSSRKCDDLKLDYEITLVGKWTMLQASFRTRALLVYGSAPLRSRVQMPQVPLPKDYAFDFKKLQDIIGGFTITVQTVQSDFLPYLTGMETFLTQIQSEVRVCLVKAFDQHYVCFNKIVRDVKKHFTQLDRVNCDKQPFNDIVQAYSPILQKDANESLVAGLKKLGK